MNFKNILSVITFKLDVIFSFISLFLGLLLIIISFFYNNLYILTLGPLLIIVSGSYIIFKTNFLSNNFQFVSSKKIFKIINFINIILIVFLFVLYYFNLYDIFIFYLTASIILGFISLEIIVSFKRNNINIICKILITSIILRMHSYFISTYPIGSDQWKHFELINQISLNHSLNNLSINSTYIEYPIYHLFLFIMGEFSKLNLKNSSFFITISISLISILIFYLIRQLTKKNKLSLLSLLLLNFSDQYAKWSIQIIPMSYGIILYVVILYLIYQQKNYPFKNTLLIVFISIVLIYTHTVASFIMLLSFITIYFGGVIYNLLYAQSNKDNIKIYILNICIFLILLFIKWSDPVYPFFDNMISWLNDSINTQASLFGFSLSFNNNIFQILNVSGFLIIIAFAIIGVLYSLNPKNINNNIFSLIITLIFLFICYFGFPLFNLKNILPERWAVFIYINTIIFTSIGLFLIIKTSKIINYKYLLFIICFISSLSMITNNSSNISPLYGNEFTVKMVWQNSEVILLKNISHFWTGDVYSDVQTSEDVLLSYLKNTNTRYFQFDKNLNLDLNHSDSVFIWRQNYLTNPTIVATNYRLSTIFLGVNFENNINKTYNCIFNSYGAKAFYIK